MPAAIGSLFPASSSFEFATPERIVFGPGVVSQAGTLAASLATSIASAARTDTPVLLVTGRDPRRADPVRESFRRAGLGWAEFTVAGEPTVSDAQAGAQRAIDIGAACIVSCGGGAVIDAGKAISALATHPGDPFRFLEIIGQALPLQNAPLPFVAVPTTAGTGAEATRNAVLTSPAHSLKVSLRSPGMVPKVALIDPELALDLPPDLTACTGLDALTQLLEPWVGSKSNGLTDTCCREGLPRTARSLGRAIAHGRDLQARSDLAFGAFLSGLALAHSGLGAVHGLAGPIGGRFPAPHGAVCAALLGPVWRANVETLRRTAPDHPSLERYRQAAGWLTGCPGASIDEGHRWIAESVSGWPVPRLSRFGISTADFPALIQAAQGSSSMKGNPIRLPDESLAQALAEAL
jgi:alcohol dehydrogenase class IV